MSHQPESNFTPLEGGCRCQKVRFRMNAAPMITHCCHCRLCQASSGSAFRINSMIETEHLSVVKGEPRSVTRNESHKSLQCADCGCTIWSHHPHLGEDIAFVGVGMLDRGELLRPEAHYFTRSKHDWVIIPPGVPSFEQLGDPGKPGVRERIEAILARRGGDASLYMSADRTASALPVVFSDTD